MEFNVKSLTPPSQLFNKNDLSKINPATHSILEDLKLNNTAKIKPKSDNVSLSTLKTNKVMANLSLGLQDSTNINTPTIKGISFSVGNSGVSKSHLAGLPSRPANAVTGSQFIEMTKNMSRADREKAILQEVSKGNIPDFIRDMKDVKVSTTDSSGQRHTATLHVAPDYLAIGSNKDFIRIPMDPITAQKIADKTNTILPTKKMVDDIYKQAQSKMTPQPIQAGPQMMSNEYYKNHNNMVEEQRQTKGFKLGDLIAGHQKDVVITNRLDQNTGKVAIYGWHQPNDKAIQPLSTIHENTYADYSHGIRLIDKNINVDGKNMNIDDVLKDPNLSKLLSDEGIIRNTRATR